MATGNAPPAGFLKSGRPACIPHLRSLKVVILGTPHLSHVLGTLRVRQIREPPILYTHAMSCYEACHRIGAFPEDASVPQLLASKPTVTCSICARITNIHFVGFGLYQPTQELATAARVPT